MNNLLFIALVIAIIYYFYYYLPQQKSTTTAPPNTKPSTQSISTQTSLTNNNIDKLISQWNQVANWAQELGIDTNKKWNLNLLKDKIKQELEATKKKPATSNKSTSTPLTLKYSRSTQTDPEELESTLDNLLQSIRDLNKQL